jgi:hypothetical protein
MMARLKALLVGFVGLLSLTTACVADEDAPGCGPTAAATAPLPTIDKEDDEFYAHVDAVNSPTELTVTVLDVWEPMDKLRGPRWPEGKARVEPVKRIIILEDISVPDDAEQKKAALEFINNTVKESSNEIICTGSNVSVKKESGGEIVYITAYVFVKKGFTLNNALVRQGLATTSNPLYKSWQEKAKQQKLGIWRDQK